VAAWPVKMADWGGDPGVKRVGDIVLRTDHWIHRRHRRGGQKALPQTQRCNARSGV
jgi:hypothetical protein